MQLEERRFRRYSPFFFEWPLPVRRLLFQCTMALSQQDGGASEVLKHLQAEWEAGAEADGRMRAWVPAAKEYAAAIRDPQLDWLVRKPTVCGQGLGGDSSSERAAGRPGSSAFPGLCVTVAGYVVQRRKASRKLLFLDLIEEPSCTDACLELLVKVPNLDVSARCGA